MISSVLLVVAVGAAIGGGVRVLKSNESGAAKGREWLEESVTAWRSKELDPKQFDVYHEDLELGDLFSQFEHDDGDPYYSPDGIEERLTQVTGSNVPKMIVDSTELAALRAIEAAKKASAKREAEAAEKADGSPSTTDKIVAKALAAKDLAVQGGKSAVTGATNLGKRAVGAVQSVRKPKKARTSRVSSADDRSKQQRQAPARPRKAAAKRAPKPTAKRAPKRAPRRAPSADTPQARQTRWPSGAPKLAKGEDPDQRASA